MKNIVQFRPIYSGLMLILLASALSACGGFRQITKIENGGQSFLELGTIVNTQLDTNKLAPRDTVVIANDAGTPVSSATNLVNIRLLEGQHIPLSLGIPDFDIRFGWMFKKSEESKATDPNSNSSKTPNRVFQLFTRKLVSINSGPWVPGGHYPLSEKEIVSGTVPMRYKITAINTGNRDFAGKLAIYDKLPGNVTFDKHLLAQRVRDASFAKALLSLVPIVNLFTSDMDKYQPVLDVSFTPLQSLNLEQRLLKYDTEPLVLAPGEGIEVQFSVHAKLPRDEALLKARMQPVTTLD